MEGKENPTQNTKILVNFFTNKAISCNSHAGSSEYKSLIAKGYVEVAVVKKDNKVYIKPEYFDHRDKYEKQLNSETTST